MALNRKTFQTRALSAVFFVLAMGAGLLINHWTFFLLFTIIHFGCWLEYQRLVGLIDKNYLEITPFHKYGVMLAGWCIMLYFTNESFKVFGIQLQQLGWWSGLLFMFVLPITEILFTRNIRLKNIGHSVFGLIYISLSLGLMMDLYDFHIIVSMEDFPNPDLNAGKEYFSFPFPWFLPAVIIGTIWINDTMAYLVGSWIGRTPVSKISPKKTWEGTIGGIVLSVVATGLICSFIKTDIVTPGLHVSMSRQFWYVIAAIVAISGTLGDLLESKLKRMAGVKDSGHLMPGHGGYLDRFDSLLIAIPFVWIYMKVFMS